MLNQHDIFVLTSLRRRFPLPDRTDDDEASKRFHNFIDLREPTGEESPLAVLGYK